jgi:hypothetical protein
MVKVHAFAEGSVVFAREPLMRIEVCPPPADRSLGAGSIAGYLSVLPPPHERGHSPRAAPARCVARRGGGSL